MSDGESNTEMEQVDKSVIIPSRYRLVSPGVHVFSVDINIGKESRFQVRIEGHGISTDNPLGTFVQARSAQNNNPDYHDQFAIYVNQTFRTFINLKVRRLDKWEDPAAPVRFDIMVVE